jgi:ABC-type spermidine/putrescine transport system permease subunit II
MRRLSSPRSARRLLPVAQLLPYSAVIAVLFLTPLAILFVYSFWKVEDFSILHIWNLGNYKSAVTDPFYLTLLARSLGIGATVAAVCVLLSLPFAYAATFRYPRLRNVLLIAALVSMFASYLVRVYAFQTILGDTGIINWLLIRIGLIDRPLSFLLFNRFAVVITLVNAFFPYVLLPIWASMQNIEVSLVEAARDLGESPAGVFRRVILPHTQAGAVAAFTFAFVLASGDYVTTTLVGGTNGLMIGREIANAYGLTNNYPLGSTLAFTMLAGLALGIAAARLLPATARHLSRVRGDVRLPRVPRVIPARMGRIWAPLYLALLLVFLFLALAIVVVLSFTTRDVPSFPMTGVTLDWYRTVFHDPIFRGALDNSVILASLTAVIGAIIGTLAALPLARRRFRLRGVLFSTLVAPLAMPGLVIGIGMLSVYVLLGIQLSRWTILLGHLVFATPFVLLVMSARLRDFDSSLEEAGRDLGEGPFDVFRRVTLPIVFPAIAGAALLAAALSLDEFVITNFVSGSTVTLPLFIWSKLRIGVTPDTNAVSSIILAGLLLLVALFAAVSRVAGMRRALARGIAR